MILVPDLWRIVVLRMKLGSSCRLTDRLDRWFFVQLLISSTIKVFLLLQMGQVSLIGWTLRLPGMHNRWNKQGWIQPTLRSIRNYRHQVWAQNKSILFYISVLNGSLTCYCHVDTWSVVICSIGLGYAYVLVWSAWGKIKMIFNWDVQIFFLDNYTLQMIQNGLGTHCASIITCTQFTTITASALTFNWC